MRKFIYSLITGKNGNRACFLLLRPLLVGLSFVYMATVVVIRFLYRINILKSEKADLKVISIGNITWGGTGKTSIVSFISTYLKQKGAKPAILIRGYGQDEDRMLKTQLDVPILSGGNRLKSAKEAKDKYASDILILDDGFQHWSIKRDLDIVMINATDPFGNKNVIPAGILREPLWALKRADIIVLIKTNLVDVSAIINIKKTITDISKGIEIFEADFSATSLTDALGNNKHTLDYIANKIICPVCALGDNDSFIRMLSNMGTKIQEKFCFTDHHKYTQADVDDIIACAKQQSSVIVTTSKDWVKLKEYFNKKDLGKIEILILNINIKIKDEEKFFKRIYSIFHS